MEIKVVYQDIEQTLQRLTVSTKALDTAIAQGVYGANKLDTTEQLDQLNDSMQQLLQLYKDLLIANESSTRKSIEFLEDSDLEVAGKMGLSK